MAGQRAVVIGRSDIVGKPMALLLLHRDATVTICHSKTRGSGRGRAAKADILVAAIGRPAFVTPAFVKPGARSIDVGINPLSTDAAWSSGLRRTAHRVAPFEPEGRLLVGDVHPAVAGGGRRAHAGARRRGAADDRDADEEHAHRGRGAPTLSRRIGSGAIVRPAPQPYTRPNFSIGRIPSGSPRQFVPIQLLLPARPRAQFGDTSSTVDRCRRTCRRVDDVVRPRAPCRRWALASSRAGGVIRRRLAGSGGESARRGGRPRRPRRRNLPRGPSRRAAGMSAMATVLRPGLARLSNQRSIAA